MGAQSTRPYPFSSFELASGEEIWVRRAAIETVRPVQQCETEMVLPLTEIALGNGQTWWVKGDPADVGAGFCNLAKEHGE